MRKSDVQTSKDRLDIEETRLRLARWLAARFSGSSVTIEKITTAASTGFSAETLFAEMTVSRDGRAQRESLVVRRENMSGGLFLDASLNVPQRMMTTLGANPPAGGVIPVPELIGVEFDPAVLGSPFLVMRKLPGRVVHQNPNYNQEGWVADLEPQRRGELWRNALRMLAEIHKLDWMHGFAFLEQPARGRPGLEQYLSWIEDWYLWARVGRPHPIIDTAMVYLKEHRPMDTPVGVLWGDPSPSNMLFTEDLQVSGVLDWEMAALGPPEVDIAWWLFFDDLFSSGMGAARLAGLPDRATSIDWYESCLGRKLENLHYYDVLAMFRMAVIGMRTVDRQIDRGLIAATSNARTHSPIVRMLAVKLSLPPPEVGADFRDLVRSMHGH